MTISRRTVIAALGGLPAIALLPRGASAAGWPERPVHMIVPFAAGGPRRRVAASRPRPLPPTAINHVWAYDFVFDTCADGRTLKCLTVIDEFTRECLAIRVGRKLGAVDVIDTLADLFIARGTPVHRGRTPGCGA